MSSDVSVICFSKDRPLQLHAYLESIMYCSGIGQADISVLYKDSEAMPYDLVKSNFPDVNWIGESSFVDDLVHAVEDAANLVWWGCDDVIFKSEFDLKLCIRAFDNPEIFAFMTRQGLNLTDCGPWEDWLVSHSDDGIMIWDRRVGGTGYAWELQSSLYRRADVLKLFEQHVVFDDYTSKVASKANRVEYEPGVEYEFLELVSGPNMLEWLPYCGCMNVWDATYMAGFDFSKSVSFAVNRVQQRMIVTCNVVNTEPETLYDAYVDGKRLDWRGLLGWANTRRHEHADRFELI
jgi:hypothetical protein